MANELNIALAESGKTITAKRYQAGAAVGSPITLTEISASGFYTGNMTGSAGTYVLVFNDGSENVGTGSIVWDGTAEVPVSTLTQANVQSALTAQGLTSSRAGNLENLDAAVSSRLAPNGTLAVVTTLTNAPTVPSVVEIRQEMDSNSTKLSNLDATVSSRLAGSAYTAPTTPPTAAQIAAAVEGSLLNEADGQAVLNAIVGAIGNTNLSEVSLVAAVRADLERVGGKIDSIPTTAAPTAAANATAVWATASKTITGGTVDTLTNSPSVPSAASIASATRTELAVELARVDAAVSSRMAASESTKLDAVKAKTDALNTERLANVATTAIVGNLIAQANS